MGHAIVVCVMDVVVCKIPEGDVLCCQAWVFGNGAVVQIVCVFLVWKLLADYWVFEPCYVGVKSDNIAILFDQWACRMEQLIRQSLARMHHQELAYMCCLLWVERCDFTQIKHVLIGPRNVHGEPESSCFCHGWLGYLELRTLVPDTFLCQKGKSGLWMRGCCHLPTFSHESAWLTSMWIALCSLRCSAFPGRCFGVEA